MLIDSNADDIQLTAEVTGIPANMLRKSLERSGFKAVAKQRFARDLPSVAKKLARGQGTDSAALKALGICLGRDSVIEKICKSRCDFSAALRSALIEPARHPV